MREWGLGGGGQESVVCVLEVFGMCEGCRGTHSAPDVEERVSCP